MFPRAFAVLLLALPLIAALGDADQAKLCNAKAGKLQCCKSVLDLHPAGAKDIMKQLGIKAKKVTGSVGVNCKSVADDGKARKCIAPLQCCTIVKGHIALDCTPTKV